MMVMTMSRKKEEEGKKEGPFFVHVVGTIRVGNEVRWSLFIFFFLCECVRFTVLPPSLSVVLFPLPLFCFPCIFFDVRGNEVRRKEKRKEPTS